MSMPKITSDFKAMNMAQLKKTCKGSRRFSTRIFKTFARGNRFCSRTNGFSRVLAVDPNFEKDETNQS